MREGWEIKTLKEVCAKITDGTHQTPKYFENGFIFLSSKNVTSGKIDWDNIKYIDEKQHVEMHKRVAPRVGDILLAKNGTTGVAAMVDRDVVFDIYVSLAHIRVLDEVTPDFMLYFINSPIAKQQFNKRLKGSGVPNLHLEEIREVKIPFPKSLPEQKRIVSILDQAFAAIAKAKGNAEQNLNNAKALFESYLQAVFENKGEGWEESTLGDVCELINRGVSPKYLEENGVIVLNQKCIRDHKISFDKSRFHDGVSKKVSPEKMVKLGDVLINSTGTGTLGRVAQVREDLKNVTVDSHVTIVRPIQDLFYIDFFGWALIFIEDEIAKRGDGCGGQTELARNTLKNDFSICYPKLMKDQQNIVQKLDALAVETKKMETIYQKKINDLEELKKSILHKAFNGEL